MLPSPPEAAEEWSRWSPRCNTVGVPAGVKAAVRSLSADNAASAVGVRNAYAATYLGLAISLFILYS